MTYHSSYYFNTIINYDIIFIINNNNIKERDMTSTSLVAWNLSNIPSDIWDIIIRFNGDFPLEVIFEKKPELVLISKRALSGWKISKETLVTRLTTKPLLRALKLERRVNVYDSMRIGVSWKCTERPDQFFLPTFDSKIFELWGKVKFQALNKFLYLEYEMEGGGELISNAPFAELERRLGDRYEITPILGKEIEKFSPLNNKKKWRLDLVAFFQALQTKNLPNTFKIAFRLGLTRKYLNLLADEIMPLKNGR